MNIKSHEILDAKGLACPMPIVKTKKAMANLNEGQVIEVQATDKGSTADLKAWAESTGHQYLGTVEEEEVLMHYVRKASEAETKGETKHEVITDLEDLRNKVDGDEDLSIIDVREQAEFAFGHIPGAINIPLGEIEERFQELNQDDELHVICRTGSRSDLAAQKLSEKGFKHVKNVIPGMSTWEGSMEQSKK
ncbi:sulfurtransferase TusA family protein [Halobacillus shinanisalinarum]|uniref:Sulfurtransferase TusA family protein n=1 Tax=Halobacillus shinanisalinarum TaxID=2932258 RepID=A0ABY4H2U7_9BACI|nr:sulfurtransferase TusA family protein [Halobacillus shinanisalinarum]UOQ93947.1 sulfurtransferase TusA family protein [Halobacillus shinanisalinarum]